MKEYEKLFRKNLGFSNQNKTKKFLQAKDLDIVINWNKIEKINERLKDIFTRLNKVVYSSIKLSDNELNEFTTEIDEAYEIMRHNDIIPRLNNFGRSREDVYFSWMRGYCVCRYFRKALSVAFGVKMDAIYQIGLDNLNDINTFSKSPTADLEIQLFDKTIRLEIQSGFTGKNDIKQHKVAEASRIFDEKGIRTYVIHFDLFNGYAALVDISEIPDNASDWRKNDRFEGQIVFAIPGKSFIWLLDRKPPSFQKLFSSL